MDGIAVTPVLLTGFACRTRARVSSGDDLGEGNRPGGSA
jgi:hypothetical protein